MELLQLKYFLAAAEKENISAAAKAFMVPPSGVSAAIKKLERELGVSLFDRSANRLKLNENGKIFYTAVESCHGILQKACLDLEAKKGEIRGEIRLLILTNRSFVTEKISAFKKMYPAVSFAIQHQESGQGLHTFDLIISDQSMDKSRFSGTLLLREEVCLAVPQNNPLAKKKYVSLREIAGETLIGMHRGSSLRTFTETAFKEEGLFPTYAIECDDPHYIRQYVKMGLGVTFFPKISWHRGMDDSIRLLQIENGLYRESFLYINHIASPAAVRFAELLQR